MGQVQKQATHTRTHTPRPDDVAICSRKWLLSRPRRRGEAGEEEEEEGKGRERKGEERRSFRLISYEVEQNCEAPVGRNHRASVFSDAVKLKFVQQQLGGQEGQLEGKEGRELVSCSLKLTTHFGAWFFLFDCLHTVRQAVYMPQV